MPVPTSDLRFGIDYEETWRKSLQSRPPLEVGKSGVRSTGRPEVAQSLSLAQSSEPTELAELPKPAEPALPVWPVPPEGPA